MTITIFCGHTAYLLLVTIHVFCSDSHTARPSDVYSSTFGFVIHYVSLRSDSCVTFLTAVLHFWQLCYISDSCVTFLTAVLYF